MARPKATLELSGVERSDLQALARRRKTAQAAALRARIGEHGMVSITGVLGQGLTLDPEVFFLLFLPPLLFLDGWRIPNVGLLRDKATILELARGLVVFTVFGIGFLIHAMIPAMPLAVAFAL